MFLKVVIARKYKFEHLAEESGYIFSNLLFDCRTNKGQTAGPTLKPHTAVLERTDKPGNRCPNKDGTY